MAKSTVTFRFRAFTRFVQLFMWILSFLGLVRTASSLCDPFKMGTAEADCTLLRLKGVEGDQEVGLHLDREFSNRYATMQRVVRGCAAYFTVAEWSWVNNTIYVPTDRLMTFCNHGTFCSTTHATLISVMKKDVSAKLLSAGAKECLRNIINPECPKGFGAFDFSWQVLIIGGSVVVGLCLIGCVICCCFCELDSRPDRSRQSVGERSPLVGIGAPVLGTALSHR